LTEIPRGSQYSEIEDEIGPQQGSDLTPLEGSEGREATVALVKEEMAEGASDHTCDRSVMDLQDKLKHAERCVLCMKRELENHLCKSEGDHTGQQSHASDFNISRAIDNLNDPNQRDNETQIKYNARLAASARLIQDESDRKAEKRLYARSLEL
jgi:hypothetical protein